jgi:hypothetical protein
MSFQDILPSTTRRYSYENHRQCLEVLEQECERWEREEVPFGDSYNPYFIIDIDESSFLKYFARQEDKLLSQSWEIYDHISQSALLKTESSVHAVAAGAFNTIFSAWARPVAEPILSSTNTIPVRGRTRTKKADISWSPQTRPNGLSHKWPTLVGEVAWSEPRTKLKQDIKFWLDDPGSSVNAAITISILRNKILVESWKRGCNKPPAPTQTIEIVRNPRPGYPRVVGQLEIEFSDVFLRDKRQQESNFVLTATDMEELARHVWTYQFPKGKKDGT